MEDFKKILVGVCLITLDQFKKYYSALALGEKMRVLISGHLNSDPHGLQLAIDILLADKHISAEQKMSLLGVVRRLMWDHISIRSFNHRETELEKQLTLALLSDDSLSIQKRLELFDAIRGFHPERKELWKCFESDFQMWYTSLNLREQLRFYRSRDKTWLYPAMRDTMRSAYLDNLARWFKEISTVSQFFFYNKEENQWIKYDMYLIIIETPDCCWSVCQKIVLFKDSRIDLSLFPFSLSPERKEKVFLMTWEDKRMSLDQKIALFRFLVGFEYIREEYLGRVAEYFTKEYEQWFSQKDIASKIEIFRGMNDKTDFYLKQLAGRIIKEEHMSGSRPIGMHIREVNDFLHSASICVYGD